MDRFTAMGLFVRIVETGSFSAVAREMNMTQPTVSKQLTALERQLKTRLLNRSTRQLSLTEAGSAYFERWIPVSWRGASALRSVASLPHPVT